MSKHDHVWQYPDCPRCEVDIYVVGNNGEAEYKCHKCQTRFESDGTIHQSWVTAHYECLECGSTSIRTLQGQHAAPGEYPHGMAGRRAKETSRSKRFYCNVCKERKERVRHITEDRRVSEPAD